MAGKKSEAADSNVSGATGGTGATAGTGATGATGIGATGGTAASGSTPPPPASKSGAPAATQNLGADLTAARAQIGVLERGKAKLEKELADAQEALQAQKELNAQLQQALNASGKSQFSDLGSDAVEVGESVTIAAAERPGKAEGRVNAVPGDVLVSSAAKPTAFAKIAEQAKGKARVFVVSPDTIAELRELKHLRT